MRNKEKLFFAESTFEKIRNLLLYICILAVIVYSSFYFEQNPVLICIIIVFCSFFFIIIGNSQIIVYQESLELNIHHPISFFSLKRQFSYQDIQSIHVDLRLSKNEFLLTELFSSFLPGFSIWNTLRIRLNDGSEKVIQTSVYNTDLIHALQKVRTISQDRIIVVGI